ncbi:MAG: UDP binding domain-containing protein, partial [Ferrovibrio sp.]
MFRNSNSLDLARMVLLGVIGISWSVVISVGAFLIVQAYSEEISKGPPFADQAMAVAEEVLGTKSITYADDPYAATEGADALILATEWRQFKQPDFRRL